MLYRHAGFVQTQALYSMEAPWLPKSESGTRSPSLHLRHRGNAFSTKSPPSFPMEGCTRQHNSPPVRIARDRRRSQPGEPPPLHPHPHCEQFTASTAAIIPQIASAVSREMKFFSSLSPVSLKVPFQLCLMKTHYWPRRNASYGYSQAAWLCLLYTLSITGVTRYVKRSVTVFS